MYIFNKMEKLFPTTINDNLDHSVNIKKMNLNESQCRSRTIVNRLFTLCSRTKSVKYKQ